jgi:hypothetical protein
MYYRMPPPLLKSRSLVCKTAGNSRKSPERVTQKSLTGANMATHTPQDGKKRLIINAFVEMCTS